MFACEVWFSVQPRARDDHAMPTTVLVVVSVFQWGWGENLLDYNSNGGIAAWLPMFLFVILFGLSMDYHVFILSRVREYYDRGPSTEEAVARGISRLPASSPAPRP